MRDDLRHSLANLKSLDPKQGAATSVHCKICGGLARFFDVTDFHKHGGGYAFGPSGISVQWFRCDDCEFLFTTFFDDWSPDDFARFVYNADYIKVDPGYVAARPAAQAEALGRLLGPPSGLRILDYGSGAGLMVSRLHENGFDIHGYDPFSSPERPVGQFDLVTCIEVIEHSPDPMALLRDMRSLLKNDGGILLSEALQPANIEEIRCNWWYCAPRNGHCSTFSTNTLALAAERLGWRFHPGGGRHALTSREGGRVAELLERITGPRLTSAMLGAPAGTPAPGWHGIEMPHTAPFRWTASPSVMWRVPFSGTGTLEVKIPLRMSVLPDFPKDCRILIDGCETETLVRQTSLSASITRTSAADGTVMVELRTPALRTPRELRNAPDDRPLGLAIPVLKPANTDPGSPVTP